MDMSEFDAKFVQYMEQAKSGPPIVEDQYNITINHIQEISLNDQEVNRPRQTGNGKLRNRNGALYQEILRYKNVEMTGNDTKEVIKSMFKKMKDRSVLLGRPADELVTLFNTEPEQNQDVTHSASITEAWLAAERLCELTDSTSDGCEQTLACCLTINMHLRMVHRNIRVGRAKRPRENEPEPVVN